MLPILFTFYSLKGTEVVGTNKGLRIYDYSDDSTGPMLAVNRQNPETGRYDPLEIIENSTVKQHITFVVQVNYNSVSKSYSNKIKVYLNGEFLTDAVFQGFEGFSNLSNLRITVEQDNVDAEEIGNSICIDNYQVNSFGSGSGEYYGDLSTLFTEDGYNKPLTEIADSVLYSKR